MENFRFIEELCVYLQSNLVHSAIFARHIAHILPNYHTERIKEQTPIIVKSRHRRKSKHQSS